MYVGGNNTKGIGKAEKSILISKGEKSIMLDTEFLIGLLGNEEVPVDDKIKQILAEHEADTNATTVGLVKKRDELLGKEVKLKEQIATYESRNGEQEAKIAELNGLLEKANAGDKKAEEYYNTKLAEMQTENDKKLKEMTDSRDYYLSMHIADLEDKAYATAMKDLNFVPGLKEGFIARVKTMNDFEPLESEGTIKFVNKDNHTIEDVVKTFAMSPEGKAYIANPSTGGGAKGSSTSTATGGKTMTRSEFNDLQARDPKKVQEFFQNGGRIEN